MADKGQRQGITKVLLENRSPVINVLLIIVDILTVSIAVLISAVIRYLLEPVMGGEVNWPLIFNGLLFYVLFALLLAWLNGLYPGFGLASVHELQKVLYVISLATIFLGVFLFLQQLALAYSRFIFILTWFLSALFMMLGRFALRNVFSRFEWWGIPIAVIGSVEHAAPVMEQMLKNRRLGFRPVCLYKLNGDQNQADLGVPIITTKGELQALIEDSGIEHVIFTDSMEDIQNFNIHWMRDVFPNILFVLNTAPFGSLWVRTIDLHGTLVIETNYHLLNKRETVIKRVLDMVLTFLLLLVSWPVFLLLALLIKIDSKGPVLYTQKRLGQDGELFDSYKFRTMYENAEEKLQDLLAKDYDAHLEYEKYHKLASAAY